VHGDASALAGLLRTPGPARRSTNDDGGGATEQQYSDGGFSLPEPSPQERQTQREHRQSQRHTTIEHTADEDRFRRRQLARPHHEDDSDGQRGDHSDARERLASDDDDRQPGKEAGDRRCCRDKPDYDAVRQRAVDCPHHVNNDHLAMSEVDRRALTAAEQAVVTGLLTLGSIPGFGPQDVARLRVVAKCDCGCAGVDFETEPRPGDSSDSDFGTIKAGVLVDAFGVTESGVQVGIILWGTAAQITALEIYMLGRETSELPRPESLHFI
jgi:hypothetical protein